MGKIPMKRRWMILMTLFVLSTTIGTAQKVSLNFSQTNLRSVLESITQQTDYTLAFSKEVVDLNDAVTIRVTDTDLKQVLDQLFTPRNIGYELRDNKIYIFEKPAVAAQTGQAPQQEIRLSGQVTDENGDPIIGANIAIPGTTTGTITDMDGNFSLSVPRGASVKVSYIGYLEQQFTITNQTQLEVQLQEDTEQLDELVVIGYGVQRKSVVTAAISRVTAEELNTTRPSRVEDALKGKVSGVQITQSSGQPGANSKVRIRGTGTVNNSDPLYIVDGMAVDGGIDYLNPVDIQSVEILKDAASAAIYGTRGANGVVLVTTKSGGGGLSGKTMVNYDFSYGWQNPWKLKSVLNAKEYMILMNESQINDGNAPRYSAEQIATAGKGTDWQRETFYFDAPVQSHQVSINGGNQKSQYFLSFGYFAQDGIVGGNYDKSNFERYSVRSNSTYTVFETDERNFLNKVRIGTNIGYSRTKSAGIDPNSEYGTILGSALTFNPTIPVYADSETAKQILVQYPHAVADGDRVFSIPPAGFQEIGNPVAMLNQPRSEIGNSDKIVSTFWGEIDLLPSLKFRSSYGVDLAFWGTDGYQFPHFLASQGKNVTQSSVWSVMNRGYRWQLENYMTYNKTFDGLHNLTVVAGQSASKYTTRYLRGDDYDLLENDANKANINSAIADRDDERVEGGTREVDFQVLASYFGRIDYNFDERYMIQLTVRRDGSSNFGPRHKWATFPAVSVGYNLLNEPFMQDARPEWFDAFKLRFSWGRNGNDKIGNLRYASLMDGGQNYYFGGGYNVATESKDGVMQYGTSPGALANPYLGWEESEQTDIGFDARFLRGSLTFGFDYYKKKTIGMLIEQPIPGYVGVRPPMGNVGTMANNGFEFELGWRHEIGDFKYNVLANASYMKNKLESLGNESGEIIHESAGASGLGDFIKGKDGEVWPFFYGYKTAGIFQNQAEIDAYVNSEGQKYQPDAQPGDVRFVDTGGPNGVPDGIIDDNDRTKIGKGAPDWTFGLTLNSEYKDFDLTLFFQGTMGNDIFDFSTRGDIPAMNRPSWMLDRWVGEGTSNKIPRMTAANPNSNWRSSDLYIKDGSYVRLKTAQLGYTLPASLTRKVSVQKLRIYVSAENLLTFTKYDGFDPEAATTDEYWRIGVDRGIYPQARTISLGANISF